MRCVLLEAERLGGVRPSTLIILCCRQVKRSRKCSRRAQGERSPVRPTPMLRSSRVERSLTCGHVSRCNDDRKPRTRVLRARFPKRRRFAGVRDAHPGHPDDLGAAVPPDAAAEQPGVRALGMGAGGRGYGRLLQLHRRPASLSGLQVHILHEPSVKLRGRGGAGDSELLQPAEHLRRREGALRFPRSERILSRRIPGLREPQHRRLLGGVALWQLRSTRPPERRSALCNATPKFRWEFRMISGLYFSLKRRPIDKL